MVGKHVFQRTVKLLFLICFAVVVIFPFYWALSSSFKPGSDILSDQFVMFPKRFTLIMKLLSWLPTPVWTQLAQKMVK